MLVKVIVDQLPYVGKRGDMKEVPDPEANVLLLLGVVAKAQPVVKAAPAAKVTKKKRQYRRKDVAKAPETVVAEPVEPPSVSASTEPEGVTETYPSSLYVGFSDE